MRTFNGVEIDEIVEQAGNKAKRTHAENRAHRFMTASCHLDSLRASNPKKRDFNGLAASQKPRTPQLQAYPPPLPLPQAGSLPGQIGWPASESFHRAGSFA